MLTQENPVLYLLTSPQHQVDAARYGLTPAHLAYRVGNGPHLYRTQLPAPIQGGIMVLDNRGFDGAGNAEPFCQEVVRECTARGFQGVFCDFEGRPMPILERVVAMLAPTFQRRGWNLYVPQGYPVSVPEVKVVVSTALSGGSLCQLLQEAVDTFGAKRVALGLQWSCEDFTLPAHSGSGVPLTAAQLRELLEKRRPSVYFSNDLCAHYFTYMPTGGNPHFILYDDAVSMAKKLQLAKEMGIQEAFLPHPEDPETLLKLLSSTQKETP